MGVLRRRDLGLAASCDRPHVAVHAFDLDRLPGGDAAFPVELGLGGRALERQERAGREAREAGEGGNPHGHSSLDTTPGGQSLMSPSNDSSSSRAVPEPMVKLNRCFALPVSRTGKH